MLLKLANWLTYDLLQLDPDSRFSGAVEFFLYDSIKILLLLWSMIFIIGIIRTWLPEEKIRAWMSKSGIAGNTLAALFGAVTPFCSCSSIPLFISFRAAGIPLGASFSFLITSPLINEYLVVLMAGSFGWKIALAYVISGLLMGILAGIILGRMGLERFLEADMMPRSSTDDSDKSEDPTPTLKERLIIGWNEAKSIVGKIWHWVLIGVAVGAAIHNYVPEESIHELMATTGIFSVPLATLFGVPLYGSCAAIVPIAVVLFEKGIPLGTALAFMMAMAALSLPEAIMLRRVMKLQLIALFFGITTAAIIVTGYLFNALSQFL